MKPARKNIFIGAATESSELAIAIAQAIDKTDSLKAHRWWSPGTFKNGDYVLEQLRNWAGQVDGAVLIAEGVDQTRSREEESPSPRDNVILEYGIFVAALGRARCVLAATKGTKLPSDTFGVVHEVVRDNPEATAEAIVRHFESEFQSRQIHNLKVARSRRIPIWLKVLCMVLPKMTGGISVFSTSDQKGR